MKRVFIVDGRFYLADNLNKYNAYLLSTGKPMINPLIHEVPKDAIVSDIVDGVFSQTKYTERKQKMKEERYEKMVDALVRKAYNMNLSSEEYYAYVEQCKAKVKNQLNYDW